MNQLNSFVSTSWLANNINDRNLRIIDASWYLPTMERDANAEFLQQHIPKSIRFDLDEIADCSSNLPHMIANAKQFASQVGAFGISQTNKIVIYDGMGIFSAARVWWNFKIMGAENVYVLAGGLPKWIDEGHDIESGYVKPKPVKFVANLQANSLYSANDIVSLLHDNNNNIQIVDLRPRDRFLGKTEEPRKGLRKGHIPNSKNLPFTELVKNGEIISADALKTKLKNADIDIDRPIVTTCGSGVTAPILNLALSKLNIDCLEVFDGSWAQWGAEEKYPIAN